MDKLEEVREELRSTLEEARERMRKYYDRKRQQQPEFSVGDRVLLNAKNI